MRSAEAWLREYGESHQHPTNELLHFVCVPAIVLAVLGLLWSLPVPVMFAGLSPWLNWATLAALAALAYYLCLSVPLAAGSAAALAVLLALTGALAQLPVPLWATSLAVFVLGWIGQFVGHAIEGRRPSFFKGTSADPHLGRLGALQFLLIGPLWLVAALYRALRLPY
jgi:uncharacterized membrane protein YGL010W